VCRDVSIRRKSLIIFFKIYYIINFNALFDDRNYGNGRQRRVVLLNYN
jgi:hypothetical protein